MSKKKNQENLHEEVESADIKQDDMISEDLNEETEEKADVFTELSREEQLELELAATKDKYLRLYADFDNYRRRTAKQQLELQRNAGGETLLSVLPVLDDFERAIDSNINVEDPEVLQTGFSLIYNKLKSTLEKNGLKEIDSKGKPFDTDLHEAVTNIPAPSEDLKGKVVDVIEKGYFLNDQVLRYSKVVVGQ